MKIARIAGLLLTAIIFNNIQAMELPWQYPLEGQLLDHIITVKQYLSILERVPVYGKILRALRTAEYVNAEDLYARLINNINDQLFFILLLSADDRMNVEKREEYLKRIYDAVTAYIPTLYGDLKVLISEGRARMAKES